ncbi:MAG: hypothetical protein V3U88_05915 [Methylococcales bacterium]
MDAKPLSLATASIPEQPPSPYFSPVDEMITTLFEFTTNFKKDESKRVYFRLNKISCG